MNDKIFVNATFKDGEDIERFVGLVNSIIWNPKKQTLIINIGDGVEDELTEITSLIVTYRDLPVINLH